MIRVTSYNKKQKNIAQIEMRKKLIKKWSYRLMVVCFVATVIFALFFSDFLRVTEIKINGTNKLSESVVRKAIEEKLEGKYLDSIKKNNWLLINEDSFAEMLKDSFKRIENVQVKKNFPAGLEFEIKERQLAMLLCSDAKCFTLNENGEAYWAENFTAEELAEENLLKLTDLSGVQILEEVNPLEENFRMFILQLESRIWEEVEIVLRKEYETPSRMSGDLKVETEEGWKIYFSESVGMEKELLMLKTVLENKIEKERRKDLEYIDLRINNKIFYKFKEGVEENQEVEDIPAPVEEEKKVEKKKDKKKKK